MPHIPIQSYFPSSKPHLHTPTPSQLTGDGFTSSELSTALKSTPAEPWIPPTDYTTCDIRDLQPGPRAVTFMGRVANLFDVANTPRTPRSAKGCIKMCVKDDEAAITVRLWYAATPPKLRLGSLVSIWTNHISNGENGNLASLTAPLFTSIFPGRDRSCHFMVHENSDNGTFFRLPLGYREGRPLNDVMTLINFVDGGYEVDGARVLVVVKSIGERKKFTRKDESVVDNINLRVHDDTAQATLGLWGTCSLSPAGRTVETTNPDAVTAGQPWQPHETALLLQSPGCKPGRTSYLSLTSSTIIDIDPSIPDATWLRRWAQRQHSREDINPAYPTNPPFSEAKLTTSPVRCLYTIADLDDFIRATKDEHPTSVTFQGYLSVLITGISLVSHLHNKTLFSASCGNCANRIYSNTPPPPGDKAICSSCACAVSMRLNPHIIGAIVDETGTLESGTLLLSDAAWRDLLGKSAHELASLSVRELQEIEEILAYARVTMMFGWTADEKWRTGGRVCVFGVRN